MDRVTVYIEIGRGMAWLRNWTWHLAGGFWLGLFDPKHFDKISFLSYAEDKGYRTAEHNARGFYDWEARAIDEHFGDVKRVIVAAAGGGREMAALAGRGMAVTGFECHPALLQFGIQFLREQQIDAKLLPASFSEVPDGLGECDGIVVGWGCVTHIPGRARRIAFLKKLAERLPPGGPMLMSFFACKAHDRPHRASAAIASTLRRLRGREPVELGDTLGAGYEHIFTREQLAADLAEVGLELVHFSRKEFAHAVARKPSAEPKSV